MMPKHVSEQNCCCEFNGRFDFTMTRLTFAGALFLTMLILLRKEFPSTDIYEAPGRIADWFKGLVGSD